MTFAMPTCGKYGKIEKAYSETSFDFSAYQGSKLRAAAYPQNVGGGKQTFDVARGLSAVCVRREVDDKHIVLRSQFTVLLRNVFRAHKLVLFVFRIPNQLLGGRIQIVASNGK